MLFALAGVALVFSLILGYIGLAVLNPQHFAHRATSALDDAAVRAKVASAVSNAISGASGAAVPSDQVNEAVDEVIAEPQFASQFRAAIVKVHTALVENGADNATLELSGIGPLVAKRLQPANPGMPTPGSVPPVRLEIKPPSGVRSVVKLLHSLSWLPAVLGLIALALFAALLARSVDRVRALRRAAITTLGAGVVLLALYFVLREVVVHATSDSGVAGGIVDAYFGDFAIASLVLAGAGALGWWGASRSAAAIRTEPSADLSSVESTGARTPSLSEAATRVLGSRPFTGTREGETEPDAATRELTPQPARVDLPIQPEAPPEGETSPPPEAGQRTKTCPDCAETVLAAARVCKHCGYRFEPLP